MSGAARKQTVLFCGNWTINAMVGVKRYASQLLGGLDALAAAGELPFEAVLLAPKDAENIPRYQCIRVERSGMVGKPGSQARRLGAKLWPRQVFPRYAKQHPSYFGADLALGLPPSDAKLVAIHDCIRERFYTSPEDDTRYQRTYVRKVERIAADEGIHILTVSQCSKRDLMDIYGIEPRRISVIGNGWEHMPPIVPDDSVFEGIPLREGAEYFFSLGSLERHKNLRWVVDAARANPAYDFVISGMALSQDGLDDALPPNVFFTGHLDDARMKALLLGCRALIQPSFYEGFCIPPLEALSLGKEVLCARSSCLPEIYGDSVRYFDPAAPGCDLAELLAMPVGEASSVLEQHSWARASRQLAELLSELLSEGTAS